jgi:hypothetical protein
MVDGELTESQKTELEAHLAVCGDCARLYDAFAFISSAIGEGLADPPESLRAGVMDGIRAQGARHPAVKKRPRVWARMAALAACLAVVVFAAVKSGAFFPSAASSSAVSGDTLEYAADAAPTAVSAGVSQTDSTASSETDGSGSGVLGVTADATAEPFAKNESRITAVPEETLGGETAMQAAGSGAAENEKTVSLMSISSVAVFSGDSEEPNPEPITTVTDEKSIVAVMDLLAFSEAGTEIEVSGAPVFIFRVTVEDGSDYDLSVWIVDGRLCCVSDTDGILYIAAGDAGDLFALIAAA